MSDPIVVFSSCEGPHQTGDWPSGKYNGGVKLQNLWVKLLRQHGVDAYIATFDGHHQDWLIEHQPHVSIDAVRRWITEGHEMRIVTTWLAAEMVLDLMPRPYFFDAEAAHSFRGHYPILAQRFGQFAKIGTHSRTIQGMYISKFDLTPVYIQEWSDPDYWMTDEPYFWSSARRAWLVGYMNEGAHTAGDIEVIKGVCQAAGVTAQFTQIQGDEQEVIDQMHQCDVFLGMNPGKDGVIGEGCPRAQQEALHCGCIVAAYDVLGNREYIHDGYTGYLAPRGCPVALAGALLLALTAPDRDHVRARGYEYAKRFFVPNDEKWQQVKAFLDL